MTEWDVVIAGAGPSGLMAAREASHGGLRTLVLEEHDEIGVPEHCAGLVSIRGLGLLNLKPRPDFVRKEIFGAVFHSPTGRILTLRKKEIVALVLDRARFDRQLAEGAMRSGAEIKTGVRVEDIEERRNGLIVGTSEGSLKCRILVDAEGIASRLASKLGLTGLRDKRPIPAFQYELEASLEDESLVHVYLGRKLAPGFFAWIIPSSSETIRVGLACNSGNPLRRLEAFIREVLGFRDAQTRGKVIRRTSWPIVTGGPIARPYASRILLVGDVAGQVKPTTGWGIVTGGFCGMMAGRAAAETLAYKDKDRDSSIRNLGIYQKLWKARWGRELRLQRILRKALDALSDKDIEEIFKVLGEGDRMKDLERQGDMDFQSGILKLLLAEPRLWRLSLKALGDIIRN
ncbi:MAG: NAD(P)/FAD-dependent oxidoreductase [Candidatus Bathyarchaeia archaeon]